LAGWSPTALARQDDDNVATFEMEDLLSRRADSGRPYLPFLDRSTLRCGVYVLPAGGEDRQQPHDSDEVYYVLSGRGSIRVDGDVRAVAAGSVIYVKAGADHRFIDIEQELQLLVFFD
jgi:mannose-6-phosphate isomerase-like protein (cupin superfamily)